MNNLKVFISSLGCDKNLCDTEHALALLAEKGYVFTDSEEEADIGIVNSCAFIGDASEESIQEILRLAAYKETGKMKALIVMGCLAERFQEDFYQELPEVDGILGIAGITDIDECIRKALKMEKPEVFPEKERKMSFDNRVLTNAGHYAYLKIADGCNKACTYCIIPKIRGAYRSVPMEELIKESTVLAERGVKELILVAQETTLYGMDLYGKKSLHVLLHELSQISGIEMLRILYCYPEELYPELIQEIAENSKVMHYLDIPIQSGSDRILKKMGRKTTKGEILENIKALRKRIPDIVLRTTFITGFPGEEETDFEETLDLIQTVGFQRVGAFTYSQEEGTKASLLQEQIPEKVKADRRDRLMAAQQKISLEFGKSLIGKELNVIIEGRIPEENLYVGRTYMDTPDVDGLIFLESDETGYLTGDIVKAFVTDAKEYDLIGTIRK